MARARHRVALVAAAAVTLLGLTPGAAEAATDPADCTAMSFTVPNGTMGATLCVPHAGADTVMVLISGAGINQKYWDATYQPETYSFRRAMNAGGLATLAVDRLGTGTSSRPPSAAVTSTGQAADMQQIITALRTGLAPTTRFTKVILGGVSLGAGIAVLAAIDGDVDGVLLTGYSHNVDPIGTMSAAMTFRPAASDPLLAGLGYDLGWLTTAPGTLADSFLPADTDPIVRAVGDTMADAFALPEMLDGMPTTMTSMTTRIAVPVLVVNGALDRLCAPQVCADSSTLFAAEAPFFKPGMMTALVLPGAGHAINLAPNARDYQDAVLRWADAA
ncbi:alpha/beta hydrolase [Nocardia sp. NPDC050630]|uniref:alpha/beta hydrolase n=1 Tax=Nocardia sp. NPDC050630 TaxID=3364321 RepID=UPI0037A2DA60